MTDHLTRRDFLTRAAAFAGAGAFLTSRATALPPATGMPPMRVPPMRVPPMRVPPVRVTVYKDPSCGCCTKWTEAMRTAGFGIDVRDTPNIAAVKSSLGVPDALTSCHTGVVAGYLFEGHVPPDLIQKVLRERPPLVGLFVPGMPSGSPGMESPNPDRYDIIAVSRERRQSVYATRMGRSQA